MDPIIKKSLSYKACQLMAAAAIRKAEELKMTISITFVDESGVLKAFYRMDHSPLVTIDASRKKAVTAVGYGIPSGDSWYSFIKDDPILFHGVQQFKDFILLGGGSPIIHDGSVIGAIGISGGHYKQDEECVKEALKEYNSNS
ncbi:MAG: heme-binding protein [Bacteroidetes bacterium]|nr:heme-binding protein [Bacteroidota bacterium]